MPRRKPAARRKRKPRDLNAEVANALGAVTGTQVPRGEDLLGSDEAKAELARARAQTSKRP